MSIGWFGVPGKHNLKSKTHLVKNGKPVCGAKIGKDTVYQQCCDGIDITPECGHCKPIVYNMRHEAAQKRVKKPVKKKTVNLTVYTNNVLSLNSLVIEDANGGYRLAGAKVGPGATKLRTFKVDVSELKKQVDIYAQEKI